MLDLIKTFGIAGVAILAGFYLIRDVLGPLVKTVTRKAKGESGEPRNKPPDNCPLVPDIGKIAVLEFNLNTLNVKVTDFTKALEDAGISVDNKLDIVLAEMKEMREEFTSTLIKFSDRLARTETHIEHLLKMRRSGG